MENRTAGRPAAGLDFVSQLSICGSLAGFSAARWALTLSRDWGYRPAGWGLLVGLCIALAFAAVILITDFLLARLLARNIRSALWLSALLGPYLGLVIYEQLGSPVWGHFAGAFATVLLFALFYALEKRLKK